MGPLKLFSESTTYLNLVIPPIVDDIWPLNLGPLTSQPLLYKYKYAKLFKVHNEAGTSPLKSVKERSRKVNMPKLPMLAAIGPVKSLTLRSRTRRSLILVTAGNGPVKRLTDKFNSSKFRRLAIQEGMEPENLPDHLPSKFNTLKLGRLQRTFGNGPES